jgi:hypothetical protein
MQRSDGGFMDYGMSCADGPCSIATAGTSLPSGGNSRGVGMPAAHGRVWPAVEAARHARA